MMFLSEKILQKENINRTSLPSKSEFFKFEFCFDTLQ